MDDQQMIADAFEDLMKSLQVGTTEENKRLIRKAFEFANQAHSGARRRSGEPYIVHPIAVAKIVATEIGLGTTSVISALLHDVVEDTKYTLDDIKSMFGYKVAEIVDGLTKIKGTWNETGSSQAESFKKVFMTLTQDVRVILIKMGDRLHNMRTLASMPEHKRVKIASETLYIYAPLAHRMGFYAIKSELEDLSLRYEHPEEYESIVHKIAAFYNLHENDFKQFINIVSEKLTQSGCKATVKLISRGAYSAWNKMQTRNADFDDIQDLFAVRVVFEPNAEQSEKLQCWNIYSLITDMFNPRPNSLRDMVSAPQVNGYEAIHMTVMSNFGQWVDMQIRSLRMDEVGERGWAMYRKYKAQGDTNIEFEKWLQSIKEMLMRQQSDAVEFVNEFKLNLFAKEIRVFTPKGEMRTLPKGASVLDFAYDIHSEVGNACIGAKVNRKLVTMKYLLQTGDQVEILTNNRQKPQREWMDYVKTAKAKTIIGNYLRKERNELIRNGMLKFETIAEYLNVENEWDVLNKLIQKHGLRNKEDLYIQMASDSITQTDVRQILLKPKKISPFKKYWSLQFFGDKSEETDGKHESAAENGNGELVISPCCSPIPGDDVVGLEMGGKIMVHKRKCPEAIRLMANYGDKIVPVKWTQMKSFLTALRISGLDRVGVINEITQVIVKEKRIAVLQMIHFEVNNGIFNGYVHVYVHNKAELDKLIAKIADINGIEKVTREENCEE